MLTAAAAEPAQRRVAGGLARRGVGPEDRVAFLLPSSPSLLVALLGALRSGVVPVPLNPALLAEERRDLLADAEPALVVDDEETLAALLDGPEAELAPVPRARPMHFTSGTTGTPKGVWSGVLADDEAQAMFDDEAEQWAFDARDVHLVCSPLHHSVAIRFSAGTLLSGGAVIVLPRFDAATAAHVIAEHRPTTTFMVPSHLQRLFALGDQPDMSCLRLMVHAGAPCPERLKLAALDTFPAGAVWEFYGATEGQFTACSSTEWLDRPGTVGRARSGRTLSVDDDGTIWCRPPPFGRFEYWRDPEKTATAWRRGAFTVGDLGRLDDDGFLYLDGRRDDLVISGGVNVYPAEVERALRALDGVRDVAVFGVADERWGQRVCAAVVGDVTPAEVLAHARAHLAGYKVPKEVHVVDELPHTSTGKLRRGVVASQLGLGG